MVWIQIRIDILSVLILVQTVSKDYQQTIKVVTSKEKVKQQLSLKIIVILENDLTLYSIGYF